MAKKKTAPRKAKAAPVLSRLEGNLKKLQRDAEAMFNRTRKQAVQLLSRDQKRALDRVVGEVRRLRTDFDKRVQRASKDVEARAKDFFATLEKQAERRLEPVVKRLVGPSRQEIQSLSRRVRHLEERLQEHTHTAPPAAPPPAPAEVAPSPSMES